ncbi:hypothetical protein [Larkinella soli]|uniref:hypothetical protein n=1 Tax=Larkinella soli TaxID=1770527 RepID=UPI000FFB1A4F|nr:hypothetical protein [Larkinella soli]
MKRLLPLLGLALLSACDPSEVKSTCYACEVYTTDAGTGGRLTKEFCNKADMERYVEEMKAKPGTALVSCRNK